MMEIVDKKGTGRFGKIIRLKELESEILGRKVVTRVWEYENGMQRCRCYFVDKNRSTMSKLNTELRKKIYELETKLEEKRNQTENVKKEVKSIWDLKE
ncbi:hypothetical protein LCGC14_1395470 [marine sediment metagenome]|uniref:Uncharacterized protein n=1 Tax=marine sediment metagenome TaxID=412755 RepID=A0A0F9KJL2_9ZZZZ